MPKKSAKAQQKKQTKKRRDEVVVDDGDNGQTDEVYVEVTKRSPISIEGPSCALLRDGTMIPRNRSKLYFKKFLQWYLFSF
jgi:archaellum component FlaF (FlaF/FlaG flagellin family)